MSRGFGGLNTGGRDNAKPEDLVETIRWGKDFTQVRVVGEIFGYAMRWITIETAKGVVNIPKVALNYDPDTDTMDDTIEDPYHDIPNPQQLSKQYFFNSIVRDLQDEEPKESKKSKPSKDEVKSGFMDSKKSKTWTPIRVGRVPPQAAKMIQALMQMNKHKVKGKVVECDPADPKYGCDIFISYDEKATPKYNVQKGNHTPLTEEEEAYFKWRLDNLMKPESLAEARKEAENLSSKSPVDTDTEEDEEEDDDALAKKKKKKKDKDKGDKSSRRDKSSREDRSERRANRDKTDAKKGVREKDKSSSKTRDKSDRSSKDRSAKRTTRRGI